MSFLLSRGICIFPRMKKLQLSIAIQDQLVFFSIQILRSSSQFKDMLQSLLNSGYQTLNNIPRESFCLTIQIIAGPIGHPKMLHHLHCSKNVCSPSSFQIWHVNNNILILSNSLHDSKNSCSIRPFQELWVISANSITAGQLHHFRKGGYPTPVHLLWVMIKTPRMLGPLYHSIFSWLLLFQKCTLPTTFKAQWAGSPIPFKEP